MQQPLSRTPTYPEQLSQIKQGIRTLAARQPQTIQAFTALHRVTMTPGALDPKTKELIALAIGIATHCDGCIAFHTHDALKAGATEAEEDTSKRMSPLSLGLTRHCGPDRPGIKSEALLGA